MRLELEQNHPSMTFAENAVVETSTESLAEQAAEHLREGIKAAQAGNRPAARNALLRAANLDPRSESAWLWLSSISEYPEELLVFLTNVLEINPLNARALEWSAATRSLLAKNFVQRGIDAAEASQAETAVQHFNQALEYDERNSMAWLWLASLCESNEGKLSYLEKVLEFDPENETAKAGFNAARNSIRENLLAEARTAAVAGKAVEAEELLDAIIAEEPDAEDAWVLRSHLANGFEAKIAAFQRVLEINPENAGTKAGLESLTSIMDAVAASESAAETVPESIDETEMEAAASFDEPVNPTGDEMFAEETRQESAADEPVWEPVAEEADELSFDSDDEGFVEASPFNSLPEAFADELDAPIQSAEEVTAETLQQPAEDLADESLSFSGPVQNTESENIEQETSQAVEEPAFTESGEDTVSEEITYEMEPEEAPVEQQETTQAEEITAETSAEEDEVPAISPPAFNPFESPAFQNAPDEFATMLSIDLDAETSPAVENLDPAPAKPAFSDNGFNVPFDATLYGANIPRPDGHFENVAPLVPTGYETRLVTESDVAATTSCPFCTVDNDVQAIACQGCLSVLTLADLELILANQHADKTVLRQAVEKMEAERSGREFSEAELTTLGIGHLNLRNLQYGYNYLQEASQKNPDNVVLSSQVNALLIRLEEIKQQDEAHESMSKGKTILVVDDSPTVRKLIAGKLEKCGHEVFCSSDGVEAMEQLEALRPDLVLLDITMPRMDGYQVCKLIRGNPATQDVPVVMISGKDGFFDKVRGRMAGTSGYITKPFGPETLMKAVESYLKAEDVVEA